MRITDIQRFCMHDGPGVRTTVFFKGCPLRCAWCHNPETQRPEPQLLWYRERCLECGRCASCAQQAQVFAPSRAVLRDACRACGACADVCPAKALEMVGKDVTVEEVFEAIVRDVAFYGENGGVTFSGGECMTQIDALEALVRRCKAHHIHTAVDTSGYVPFSYFERLLPYVDLWLYDIKCMDAATHQTYVGVDNTLILQNVSALLHRGAAVRVRVPVVPSVNDSEDERERLRAFLNRHPVVPPVDRIPYHPMGTAKALALGITPETFATQE